MVERQNCERLSGISRLVVFLRSKGKSEREILQQIIELSKEVPKCVVLLAEVANDRAGV